MMIFWRLPATVLLIITFIIWSSFGDIFRPGSKSRLHFYRYSVSFFSRLMCALLGIQINVSGVPSAKKNCLFVANHLSYIDILAFSSVFPALFVSSIEVSAMPFLGTLARLAGTLFVERRNRSKIAQETDRIATLLSQGFPIVLFPEGTSSNGERILPFKSSFFGAASKAGVLVAPVCVSYSTINGSPVTRQNRDLVCWHGAMSFLPHFLKLMTQASVEVRLDFLEEVYSISRKEYASISFAAIQEQYLQRATALTVLVESRRLFYCPVISLTSSILYQLFPNGSSTNSGFLWINGWRVLQV